jgi:hypothetical protein
MYFDRETINFVQSSRSIIEEREKRKIHARDSVESIFDRKRLRIRTFSSSREQKIMNSKKKKLEIINFERKLNNFSFSFDNANVAISQLFIRKSRNDKSK